jgi:Putative peptidoglycan binding domain
LAASLPSMSFAQDKKAAAPSKKAAPKVNPVTAHYAAMPLAERVVLQSDLIWTGDYNGVANGDMAERAVAAVRAFQTRNGGTATGILSAAERAALAAAAKTRQEAAGWRIVDDVGTGARLGIPAKLVPTFAMTPGTGRWSSGRGEVQIETFRIAEPGTTLAAVLERQRKEPAGRQIAYNVARPDFFVLSGLQGLKKFYVRAHAKGGEVRGLTILYDQAMEGIMGRLVIAMSSAFQAFPAGVIAGPPPKRKVEYGSGVVIDGSHVLTDRQLTDGCYVLTLPGVGGADLVAEDKSTDLALLRIYGVRKLEPLATGGGVSGETTVVGIADPQAQGGGSAVSAVKARVAENGDERLLEPAPAPGFAGAAVLDGAGKLAGIVQFKAAQVAGPAPAGSQAKVVPMEAIKAFLTAQKIDLSASNRSGIEAAKQSVVRVICARK